MSEVGYEVGYETLLRTLLQKYLFSRMYILLQLIQLWKLDFLRNQLPWFLNIGISIGQRKTHIGRPLKLTQLSVPSSIWQWITSFLTDRQQLVRLGKFMSNSSSTNTGAPQGCVLSSLLFSLYTNDCTSKDPSVKLLKFADDTILTGLIQDGDESAYRRLKSWLFGAV